MRSGPAQNESAPTPPRRQDDACGSEDHDGKPPRSCTNGSDNRSTSAAAFEHHSSRLGAPHPQPMKINDPSGLAKFQSSRSDGRSSPPAVSSGYLSAQSQGVKAESADFIEVLVIPGRARQNYTDLAITPPKQDEFEALALYHETSGGEAALARKRREDAIREHSHARDHDAPEMVDGFAPKPEAASRRRRTNLRHPDETKRPP
jgi:hypothetical protein